MVLLARQRTVQLLYTRLSLSMALLSRRLQLGCVVQKDGLTHIHSSSRNRVQFVLIPFRSPLLRESQLISFPTATKMFQFTAFPTR